VSTGKSTTDVSASASTATTMSGGQRVRRHRRAERKGGEEMCLSGS